tara:strand:- start:2226 stop:2813 length:588 start_codon:yes stop_codon:yes gene_type:complete
MNLKQILDNLNFKNITDCTFKEVKTIRDIRNEDSIRRHMRSNKKILLKDHINWVNKIKNSKVNFFYSIKYKDKIIGGLGLSNYNKNLLSGEWSYYISDKERFIGLGASVEFKAIDYFFSFYKLKNLFCYVLRHNSSIIKLHSKFGFQQISFDEYDKNNSLNEDLLNAIYLCLDLPKWKSINYKLKFFTKNEKNKS